MLADYDSLVIGAGMAGLAAAHDLAAAGQRVALLEARSRIGGRILTEYAPAPGSMRRVAVELGAEFVHGLPPSSWDLIHDAGLRTTEFDGTLFCVEQGVLGPCKRDEPDTHALLNGMQQWLRHEPPSTDMTFAAYLQHRRIPPEQAAQAVNYVEGFNAAERDSIGIAGLARQQSAEDAIQGDRIFHIDAGYGELPGRLAHSFQASGGKLQLDSAVIRIAWRPGHVQADLANASAQPLTARRAIVTLPLGVLQARAVRFEPSPNSFLKHADRMAMGPVLRMSLLFRRDFWSSKAPQLSFLFMPDGLFHTWWTRHPNPVPLLTAWAGGRREVDRIQAAGRDPRDLAQLALADLADTFSIEPTMLSELLISTHLHDWQADRYAMGAYSYVPNGALDAAAQMSEPHAATLYFAGEHTTTNDDWGTVNAAIASGRRAARQALEQPPAISG
jgi:monoamine oxidase